MHRTTLFFRSLLVMLLTVATAGALAGCGGGEDTDAAEADAEPTYRMGPPVTDPAVALVVVSDEGSDTLAAADFQQQIQRFVQQAPDIAFDPMQMRELRRGLAEQFILRHLLTAEAGRKGITADPAAVDQQLTMLQGSFETPEEFEQALAEQDLTPDSLRTLVAQDMMLQQMQEQLLEDVEEPSAEELEDFRQEQTDQVRAAHILFPLPEPAQQDSVRRLARTVLDSIRNGADFGEMARRYSVDASAQRGGDLGFFSRRDMVDPFSDAAFALQDSGDVVERPVKTRFGYHVIQLLGRRTVPPMDSLRARTALMQIRQRAAYDDAIKALRDQVTIQVNPEVLGVDLNVQ